MSSENIPQQKASVRKESLLHLESEWMQLLLLGETVWLPYIQLSYANEQNMQLFDMQSTCSCYGDYTMHVLQFDFAYLLCLSEAQNAIIK